MSASDDLRALLVSRNPLIVASERDETRFLEAVRTAAAAVGIPVWIWSATRGLARDGYEGQYGTKPPEGAITFMCAMPDPTVFVMLDVQAALADPVVVRGIKDVAQAAKPGQTLILASPEGETPPELSDLALPFHLDPPAGQELEEVVDRTLGGLASRNLPVSVDAEHRGALVDAVRGLGATEASRLIQQVALTSGGLSNDDVSRIREGKAKSLEADGGPLELIDADGTLDAVGGLPHLKEWLEVRGRALQPSATAFGLDPPKGVLLTGVPGCGKSLIAKSLAHTWGYPLVLLDPARLYGQYVGQSEQRLDDGLGTVQSMAPDVLWIDEIEKGFAQGGASDGGVSTRILGTFLRWMQDRQPGVFVVATANDVHALPPEFLRKGRFDEVFFVDLPGPDERAAIFTLHIAKRHRDPATFDAAALAAASDGFSGAEIEAAVVGALYHAFSDGGDLTTDRIITELRATEPLSQTRAEELTALRSWAQGRAVTA